MTTPVGTAPPRNSAGRLQHIDALRAFAVLIVVVSHGGLGDRVPGGLGVTVFFVISGFVITLTLVRERQRSGGFSVRGFYQRRLAKLAPPFLVAILLPTVVYSLFARVDWSEVAAQTFFYFNWTLIGHLNSGTPIYVLPGSAVTWSLSIEEQFYVAFAVIWIFLVRLRYWIVLTTAVAGVVLLLSTGLRVWLALSPGNTDLIYYGTGTRLDGLALGILAALWLPQLTGDQANDRVRRILGSDWILPLGVALILTSLLIRGDFFRDAFRFSLQSVAAAAVILYGFVAHSSWIRRAFDAVVGWAPIQLIGLASYSIYLVHHPMIELIQGLWPSIGRGWGTVFSIVIGVLPGVALYWWLERPIARWMHARRRSRGPIPS